MEKVTVEMEGISLILKAMIVRRTQRVSRWNDMNITRIDYQLDLMFRESLSTRDLAS